MRESQGRGTGFGGLNRVIASVRHSKEKKALATKRMFGFE